jgi:GDP-4-dehydro-6-deoxy-D-mannose reductase
VVSGDKVVVTGGTGFVGHHLLDHLAQAEVTVLASDAGTSKPAVNFEKVDITDESAVADAILSIQPKYVFHLAAVSSLSGASHQEKLAMDVNVWGTRNVAAACAASSSRPRLLNVSSSQVYADASGKIDETMTLGPSNLYGATKQMAETWLALYEDQTGIVTARSFNHTGPGQTDHFVLPYLTRKIAEIEAGISPPRLLTGNLKVERDFTDVRDVVRAYSLLMERGKPANVYNVCSGSFYRISDLLDILIRLGGVKIQVEIDQSRYRSNDTQRIWGDHSKLTEDTGWQPQIPIETTLTDMLNYWRKMVGTDAQSRSASHG